MKIGSMKLCIESLDDSKEVIKAKIEKLVRKGIAQCKTGKIIFSDVTAKCNDGWLYVNLPIYK